MRYRTLGKTGLRVSSLGLGASQLGRPEVEEREVDRLLNGALDLGINFIDTAAMYKLSEARLGRYLAHRAEEVIIATKCGDYSVPDGKGFRTVKDYTPQGILRTIEQSRAKLKRELLDLVQFHGLPEAGDERRAAIEALFEARERGWVRHVGVSLDAPSPPPGERWPDDAQEFTYNVLEQESAATIMSAAKARGSGTIIKQPIANAVYLMKDRPEGMYYVRAWDRAQQLDVRELAGDMPPVAFALRFALSHPDVDTAIVGSTRLANLQANAQACEAGPLPEEVVERARHAFVAAMSDA